MGLPTPPHSGVRETRHEIPYKPSTPIQIPTRERTILSSTFSPINRPLSPDLIFEMSPVNPSSIDSFFPADFTSTQNLFIHRSLKTKSSCASTPPFMYSFPRPTGLHPYQNQSDHFAPLRSPDSDISLCSHMAHRKLSFDHSPLQHSCLTSAFEDEVENSPDAQSCICVCPRGRTRRPSFSGRISALASPTSIRIHSRSRALVTRPLSPPPSFSRTGGKTWVDDVVMTDTLYAGEEEPPLDLGFKKHAMKRTEDEKRVRVGRARVVASIQVTVESY